jgi:ATP-dependent DNA ligase
VILDGEIVALRHGRPDFGLLQSRMHVVAPDDKLLRAAPVQIYVFDLLHQGQESLLEQPYTQRRARLDAQWVEPRLVGEVAFAEWTTEQILRQPSWRGLRIDKEPGQVHRED